MKPATKHFLYAIGIALAAYLVYAIYQKIAAWIKGATDGAKNVASEVAAAASIPGLVAQGQALDATIIGNNTADYAPGGRIYNEVAASQGQAQADANWKAVQADNANMVSQTGQWWNPFSW